MERITHPEVNFSTQHHKRFLYRKTRILHNACIKTRGLCGFQMCSAVCHKMTNMVCRRLYCPTSVKLLLSFLTAHRSQRCLWKVFTRRKDFNIWTVLITRVFRLYSQILTRYREKQAAVLWHKPETMFLSTVAVNTETPEYVV